jgi:ATP-dependent RNA helicase DDX10/DBP4
MFERKNQKQELYRKVVEQSVDTWAGDAGNSDDELMVVKRVDHELPSHLLSTPQPADDISKRKLKIGQSKKAMVKYRGLGEKLVFDDDGQAHQVYEMKDADELARKGVDVMKLGKEFAEEQRGMMKEVDVVDKAIVKDKRKEKKRRQKERARVSMF